MVLESLRSVVSRRPAWVAAFWFLAAAAVGLLAPDLTRLAAEGQATLLDRNVESLRAAEVVRRAWPDQVHESLAVVVLHRPEGLTAADDEFARSLSGGFLDPTRPGPILGVMGPGSPREIGDRLRSRDRTVQLVVVPLSTSFVAPVTQDVVRWLQAQQGRLGLGEPAGLQVLWTGDAVLGRDLMANVQTSLDRAALATVVLLLAVLLVVYRSFLLALVPLATIGVSLVIARGVLAWMSQSGWEISPLVELFLIAILFGTGTDFCLFLSWRFGEHFNANNPAGAMRVTLRRSTVALLTSAGTVIVGLSLMGATRFKLFSSTGPSVAIGLVISLAATLSLTPALLVMLARVYPRAFAGVTGRSWGVWDRLGREAMAHPLLCWAATLAVMLPLAILSGRSHFVQDMMTELPAETPSAQTLRLVASKFDPGMMAPLTVVLESDGDLRQSAGLALIDDVSRFLAHQRRLVEVRSATQPLGSPATLSRARIGSRLTEVNDGFSRMSAGAGELRNGLTEGAAKLRAVLWLEQATGLRLAMGGSGTGREPRTAIASSGGNSPHRPDPAAVSKDAAGPSPPAADRPTDRLVRDLGKAAEGAGRIAEGAARASREMSAILSDPYGRRVLDHLLITEQTVRDNPDLHRSLDTYITPDGHRARIDLTQGNRVFSGAAMDQVETLRSKLNAFLSDIDGMNVKATIAGSNAESADVRAMTRSDQVQSWILVPIGVFLVLLLALRDPLACLNLVATMILTYAFALGATHLLFVTILGNPGLDWKVPYFLFVLLVAVGVDYNVFLMDRVRQESERVGPRQGIARAIAQTGGLITSAAAITASSFASFLSSPLVSLRQLGFALVVGIAIDALLVRPLLVPCGHWLLIRRRERPLPSTPNLPSTALALLTHVAD